MSSEDLPRPEVVKAVRQAGAVLLRRRNRYEETSRRRRLTEWLETQGLRPTLAELEEARLQVIREEKDRKRARLRANQRARKAGVHG